MADNDNLVDFQHASAKHRHRREHEQKEANVEAIRQRFEQALPSKTTAVKDYLKKKRAKKKRYE